MKKGQKIRRGAISKATSQLVGLWVPKALADLIDEAATDLDIDRSKFIRAAIREKALPKTSTATFLLPRKLHCAVMKKCRAQNQSFSQLVRRALRRELRGVPAATIRRVS